VNRNSEKTCRHFDELVGKHQTSDFLEKISNPEFRLLIHTILHLNRIPTYQEWDFVKSLSREGIGSKPDCERWFEYLNSENSNVSFRFISGMGIDISKLKLSHDKSGIPLVSSAVIDLVRQTTPNALLIDFTPDFAVLGTMAQTNTVFTKSDAGNSSKTKNRKFRNIFFAGLYASAREMKMATPKLYALLLKIIPKTYLKSKLLSLEMTYETNVISLPLNFTLISVYPILDKDTLYYLKLFEECNLIQIVPIIHDVLPVTFPQYFPDNTFEGSYDYLKLMGNQTNMFFVSSHVKDEFQRVFPSSLAINKYIFNLADLLAKEICERANQIAAVTVFRKEPYILSISTIEPRKNHLNLLLALQEIFAHNKHLELILLGGYGWKNQFIMRIISNGIFSSRIQIMRNISENEKLALIKGSLFTVYPSMHEGYGLPILESLLLSKRVLFHNQEPMLDFESLPGAVAIDMSDIHLLRQTIMSTLNSKEILNNSNQMQDWLNSQKNTEFLELLTRLNS